jgi:hypothetical protein
VSGFGWRVTLFWKIPPLSKPAAHSDQDAGTIQLDPNPGIEVPIATAIGTFMIECTEMVDLGATDWGDGSSPTVGQVRRKGKGRYTVTGSHRYLKTGVFQVMAMIQDQSGQEADAMSTVTVTGKVGPAHRLA